MIAVLVLIAIALLLALLIVLAVMLRARRIPPAEVQRMIDQLDDGPRRQGFDVLPPHRRN